MLQNDGRFVFLMALGSIVGSFIGGQLLSVVPAAVLIPLLVTIPTGVGGQNLAVVASMTHLLFEDLMSKTDKVSKALKDLGAAQKSLAPLTCATLLRGGVPVYWGFGGAG